MASKNFLDLDGLTAYHKKLKTYIANEIGTAQSQALVFKGTVPSTGLPTEPKVGDTYVVGTAGTYAGEKCEVGDTIICKTAKSGTTAATWLVVQKNIDGAVTTTSTLTANTVMLGNGNKEIKPLANGTAGKVLMQVGDSGTGNNPTPQWVNPVDAGEGISSMADIAGGTKTLSLKAATSSTLGGIKIGYTASGKTYPVALDSNNKAYVSVPWTDTNTTYSAGTGISLDGTTFSNSGVRSITGSNATLTVNTGGTEKSITINNVANASISTYASTLYEDTNTSRWGVENALLIGCSYYPQVKGDKTTYGITGYKELTTTGYDILVKNATSATTAQTASTATTATTATTANKVANALTITNYDGTSQTYNGSAAVTLNAITATEIDALF